MSEYDDRGPFPPIADTIRGTGPILTGSITVDTARLTAELTYKHQAELAERDAEIAQLKKKLQEQQDRAGEALEALDDKEKAIAELCDRLKDTERVNSGHFHNAVAISTELTKMESGVCIIPDNERGFEVIYRRRTSNKLCFDECLGMVASIILDLFRGVEVRPYHRMTPIDPFEPRNQPKTMGTTNTCDQAGQADGKPFPF